MSNAIRLFFTSFFALAALILAVIACAGSTKDYYPLNHIYVAQVDLSNLISNNVLSSSLASTSINLPDAINLGLWSYCIENSSGSIDSCTSPKGIQNFNLNDLIFDNIEDNSLISALDSTSILLPKSLQDKIPYLNGLLKCVFITLIIGIVLSFVSLVISVLRWIIHFRVLKWFGVIVSFLAFVALIISIGVCTGLFIVIRNILKNNYSEYGIKLSLGHIYQGLSWGSVVAALFGFMCWCSVRSSRRPQVMYVHDPVEKEALI